MDQHETPLETARRHVVEGEARVACQEARIAEMAERGQDTRQAETILGTFKDTLRFMREDLEMLEAKSDSPKKP